MRTKAQPNPNGKIIRIFLIAAAAMFVLAAGALGYILYDSVMSVEQENTFYQGVYIDGIELHGATPEVASEYIYQNASSAMEGWAVNLTYGEDSWQITPETLGMADSLREVVAEEIDKAYQVGRSDEFIFTRYQDIEALKAEPYMAYTSGIEKNTEAVDALLSEIAQAVYIAPQNASWTFAPSRQNPILITAEIVGQELDIAATKAEIEKLVNTMEAGTIDITPKPLQPAITTASIQGEVACIADFYTAIDKYSTDDRTKNLERGCASFHGLTISPGESVSFNSAVGPRTEKNGFFPALEIVSGSYEMGIGGGICQVSSTLYNAVIEAGLEVVSRKNHGIPVNYLPMGMDATVADRGIDFIFRNNTGENIYMIARVEGSGRNKTCRFQIYGRPHPEGHTYSIRLDEAVPNLDIPAPITVKDTTAEYVKYTHQTHEVDGKPGYSVQRYLVTKDSHGNTVSEVDLGVDVYNPIAPKIYVGVRER